ncbi:hypothetical protein [Staphylococcus cohnii]|uniref:ABC transporter permease n=1 Tax=Staphylococcus nepalensis TaxID=214473 RepID=UPI001868550F
MNLFIKIVFFKIKSQSQYKLSSMAGLFTQLIWGIMQIILFKTFEKSNATEFPMPFEGLVSYVWFQQAFFYLLGLWQWDPDIFKKILKGEISNDLSQPTTLSFKWFSMDIGDRLKKTFYRAPIILSIALILPDPFKLHFPDNLSNLFIYIFSITLGMILCSSMSTFIYILTITLIDSRGIRVLYQSLGDFLVGNVLPLPFFPVFLQSIIIYLPFASIANTPFLIYSSYLTGDELLFRLILQIFWVLFFIIFTKFIEFKIIKHMVINGG